MHWAWFDIAHHKCRSAPLHSPPSAISCSLLAFSNPLSTLNSYFLTLHSKLSNAIRFLLFAVLTLRSAQVGCWYMCLFQCIPWRVISPLLILNHVTPLGLTSFISPAHSNVMSPLRGSKMPLAIGPLPLAIPTRVVLGRHRSLDFLSSCHPFGVDIFYLTCSF